ncbi:hypothetical protein ANN_11719 [Periplaneta americana]|uniref:Uncharacterized protein n=1 Tax=Periplaneta americana TaxID=6978 RepID=A0ABQ8T780_PERAM|nr:hypothetical protein ANN_11719 [Periplaneta americana]
MAGLREGGNEPPGSLKAKCGAHKWRGNTLKYRVSNMPDCPTDPSLPYYTNQILDTYEQFVSPLTQNISQRDKSGVDRIPQRSGLTRKRAAQRRRLRPLGSGGDSRKGNDGTLFRAERGNARCITVAIPKKIEPFWEEYIRTLSDAKYSYVKTIRACKTRGFVISKKGILCVPNKTGKARMGLIPEWKNDVRFELTISVPQERRSRGALWDGARLRGERANAAREWREFARASSACLERPRNPSKWKTREFELSRLRRCGYKLRSRRNDSSFQLISQPVSEKARASKPVLCTGVRLECASASASASEGLSSSAVDRSWRDLSSSTVNCLWRSVVRDTVNSSD